MKFPNTIKCGSWLTKKVQQYDFQLIPPPPNSQWYEFSALMRDMSYYVTWPNSTPTDSVCSQISFCLRPPLPLLQAQKRSSPVIYLNIEQKNHFKNIGEFCRLLAKESFLFEPIQLLLKSSGRPGKGYSYEGCVYNFWYVYFPVGTENYCFYLLQHFLNFLGCIASSSVSPIPSFLYGPSDPVAQLMNMFLLLINT